MPTEPIAEPVVAQSPISEGGDSRLPHGMKLDNNYSADDFFKDTKPGSLPAVGDVKPPIIEKKEVAAPVIVVDEPTPGSLASKLANRGKPPVEVKPPVSEKPPVVDEDPAEKIEAQMRAHNKAWKPANGWNEIKASWKADRDAKLTLQNELAQEKKLRATSPVAGKYTEDQLTKMEAEHKALSDRLMVMDLENHPKFQNEFIAPKNAELSKAKDLLAAHGITADVASILSKPRAELGKAVQELIKDLPDYDRVEVAQSIRNAWDIDQKGKHAVANSRDIMRSIQAQTADKQKAAFNNRWAPVSAAIGEHVVELEAAETASAEERAEVEQYNNEFRNLRASAEKIAFSPTSEEGIADNAIKAAAYDFHIKHAQPRLLKEYESLLGEYRKATKELQAIRSRNPNHRISSPPRSADTGGPKRVEDMNHADAAEAFFNGSANRQ